jgi:hypothetical protein
MREKLDKELKINIFTIAFFAVLHLFLTQVEQTPVVLSTKLFLLLFIGYYIIKNIKIIETHGN